ncbi:MAG: 50S ribosomal protein L27 [Candidatus Vidania fulgoroideorum]
MAKKKAVGSLKNGRDSLSKRLGLKMYGGEKVFKGNIIVRQRGTKYLNGINAGIGRDFTIYSLVNGILSFSKNKSKTIINILS